MSLAMIGASLKVTTKYSAMPATSKRTAAMAAPSPERWNTKCRMVITMRMIAISKSRPSHQKLVMYGLEGSSIATKVR